MLTVDSILSQFKCLEKLENRVCSRCLRNGFNSTPAFYRFDDSTTIYLCDECHDTCYKMKWIVGQLDGVPRIPEEIADNILSKISK